MFGNLSVPNRYKMCEIYSKGNLLVLALLYVPGGQSKHIGGLGVGVGVGLGS